MRELDANGKTSGFRTYNNAAQSTEHYDRLGFLQTSTRRDGKTITYHYTDFPTLRSGSKLERLLTKVSDSFGHEISFEYNSAGQMSAMVDPGQGRYTYAYDEASAIVLPGERPVGNLTSVTYPGGAKRVYWYNEHDKTAGTNLPSALTGITDENGVRYGTYSYDNTGRPVATERAGGIDKYTLDFWRLPTLATTAVHPNGSTVTYEFVDVAGKRRLSKQTQPAASGTGTVSSSYSYDDRGNVTAYVDFNGRQTTYSYDPTRLLGTSSTVGAGTQLARTTSMSWHAAYRLPLKVAEPKRLTSFAYDASGNMLQKTVQVTADANGAQGLNVTPIGAGQVWKYTYNASGQMLTATGPRTDIVDVTRYEYDAAGNLVKVTNAANHVTTLSNYDAHGHAGR